MALFLAFAPAATAVGSLTARFGPQICDAITRLSTSGLQALNRGAQAVGNTLRSSVNVVTEYAKDPSAAAGWMAGPLGQEIGRSIRSKLSRVYNSAARAISPDGTVETPAQEIAQSDHPQQLSKLGAAGAFRRSDNIFGFGLN